MDSHMYTGADLTTCCRSPSVVTADEITVPFREDLRMLRVHCRNRDVSRTRPTLNWAVDFPSRIRQLITLLVDNEIYPPLLQLNMGRYNFIQKKCSKLRMQMSEIEKFLASRTDSDSNANSGLMKLLQVANGELLSVISVTRAHVIEKYVLRPDAADSWVQSTFNREHSGTVWFWSHCIGVK